MLPMLQVSKVLPFKGCIKELKINRAPQSFLHHNQIGLCFSNIERGSYFRGDAYVVYSKFSPRSESSLNYQRHFREELQSNHNARIKIRVQNQGTKRHPNERLHNQQQPSSLLGVAKRCRRNVRRHGKRCCI